MSNKKNLSESEIIASILEDDLSDIESSDESDSEEPILANSVLDYDDEVSRGLSRIFGEEPELEPRILQNFEDPPGPRVSVEFLESFEPVTETPVRVVSTLIDYDSNVVMDALSEPSCSTSAQSNLAQPNEAVSADITSSRPICVARNWSDKIPNHSIPKFDRQLTVNMRVTHKTSPIEYFSTIISLRGTR